MVNAVIVLDVEEAREVLSQMREGSVKESLKEKIILAEGNISIDTKRD